MQQLRLSWLRFTLLSLTFVVSQASWGITCFQIKEFVPEGTPLEGIEHDVVKISAYWAMKCASKMEGVAQRNLHTGAFLRLEDVDSRMHYPRVPARPALPRAHVPSRP